MTKPESATRAAPPAEASSPAQLMFGDLEHELASTRRMLERFPSGKNDWRPHEKSRTLARLAAHVVELPGLGVAMLTTDELDMATRPRTAKPPETTAELLAAFDGNVQRLLPLVAAASSAQLARPWTMRHGDHVLFNQSRRDLFRAMMINHLVHHRTQLGLYYRMLDVPVPAMYGPSADEAL
jgi:uncharacterized damage-inducible protein DinB